MLGGIHLAWSLWAEMEEPVEDKHENRTVLTFESREVCVMLACFFWRCRYPALRLSTVVRYAVPSAIENARRGCDTRHDSFGLVGVAMKYR